ncbi:MAG: hypothetical protein WC812_03345 [Candidatus Pacearchaeota archaeon]|jgi:hypothetical protein
MKKSIDKKLIKNSNQQLKDLMDDDIPTVKNYKTIKELEERSGRGYWGNATTGYIYDEQYKDVP